MQMTYCACHAVAVQHVDILRLSGSQEDRHHLSHDTYGRNGMGLSEGMRAAGLHQCHRQAAALSGV